MISGQADHTVPDAVTRSSCSRYSKSAAVAELKQFPGRGHSLTIDHVWEAVDYTLDWLGRHDITGRAAGSTA
jgi:hypothetical protein